MIAQFRQLAAPVTDSVCTVWAGHARLSQQDAQPLPESLDYLTVEGLRNEARHTLNKFRPATLGQAGRLAGITPADLMVLSVAIGR